MTKNECEKLIAEKMAEIKKVSEEYCGRPSYISLTISPSGFMDFSNSFYKDDKKTPINAWVKDGVLYHANGRELMPEPFPPEASDEK